MALPIITQVSQQFPKTIPHTWACKADWVVKWCGIWNPGQILNNAEHMLCYALLSSDWQLVGDQECQVHLVVAQCTDACVPPPNLQHSEAESKSLVFSLQELESAMQQCWILPSSNRRDEQDDVLLGTAHHTSTPSFNAILHQDWSPVTVAETCEQSLQRWVTDKSQQICGCTWSPPCPKGNIRMIVFVIEWKN